MNDSSRVDNALAGRMIVLPVNRRAEAFSDALTRHGARTLIAPPLSTVELIDDPALAEITREVIASPPDIVVVTTGVGLTGWFTAAEQAGLAGELTAALRGVSLVARGPKGVGAIRRRGLEPNFVAASESSVELTDHLLSEGVSGKKVLIQHHGEDDPVMEQRLRAGGATVTGMVIYRWGPPEDPRLVRESTTRTAHGEADAVLFTSAPAARAWLTDATDAGILGEILDRHRSGLLIAAVGPVTAAPLEEAGCSVPYPERFRLGALVKMAVEKLS